MELITCVFFNKYSDESIGVGSNDNSIFENKQSLFLNLTITVEISFLEKQIFVN